MPLSLIQSLLPSAQSATACSTTQYKPDFRFFGGSYIQYGVFIMIMAILLQCSAEAAGVGPKRNFNATKSLCIFSIAFLHSSYPSRLRNRFYSIRTALGSCRIKVRIWKRTLQPLDLATTPSFSIGFLSQVPSVISAMIHPNLESTGILE